MGRTEGAAVLKDAFGRVYRRCSIVTEGEWNFTKHCMEFRETFSYSDGQVDTWTWATQIGAHGQYVSVEALAGPGVVGRRVNRDFILSFKRPYKGWTGILTPRHVTRFTPMDSQTMLMTTKLSLFGIPLGKMIGFHRQVAP